ncbi:hypothetical protein PREVCOP_06109 [Segatella copri DSM 18205]|uniref:Uncharacterized protein n=1 Tax=Segatella copri DSM 18205 TaxID=537011 RepID=D1PFV2_9BACT|nr:hypothetical protein PREVCOP_06109 [Segatella copri DSM 18205]
MIFTMLIVCSIIIFSAKLRKKHETSCFHQLFFVLLHENNRLSA